MKLHKEVFCGVEDTLEEKPVVKENLTTEKPLEDTLEERLKDAKLVASWVYDGDKWKEQDTSEAWEEEFRSEFATLLRKDFKIYARPIDNPQNAEGELGEIGENIIDFIKQLLEEREKGVIGELLGEIEKMPLCEDDGYTSNDSDIDFIRGQSHFKGHVVSKLKGNE